MDNLQIITNKVQPAVVEFNYRDIDEKLDVVLHKYKGLVFTEDTAKDCKKTIAELRKGQKALDTFRINTKKELTESITDFEKDCKILYSKFTEVIDPLKDQADKFEENRREEKHKAVLKEIKRIVDNYKLEEMYSFEIAVQDKHLLASTSFNQITEEIETEVKALKEKQDQAKANRETIKNVVEKCNADDELTLLPETYVSMLQFMDIGKVIARVYEDAAKLVRNKIATQKKIEEELEAKRIAEEEKARIEAEWAMQPEEAEWDTQEPDLVEEEVPFEPTIEFIGFEEEEEEPEIITRTYEVSGTDFELKSLESFLDCNFDNWRSKGE